MITADTITDEQIRGIKPFLPVDDAQALIARALGPSEVLAQGSLLDPMFATWTPNVDRVTARARLAEILNARTETK